MAICCVTHAFYIPSADRIPSPRKKTDRTQKEHASQPFEGTESLT